MNTGQTPRQLPPLHEAWLPREHALHRPRHGGRQLVALLCAAVFFATPLVAFTLGARASEFENHRLAEFPNPLSGWGFFTGLSPWATDHLVFRESAIRAADRISRGVFGEPPQFGGGQNSAGPISQEKKKNQYNLAVPQVIEGKDGWMYYGDDVKSRCDQARPLDETLAQLRKLREGVEASGRRFVLIVAPDKTTAVPQYLPDTFVGQDCTRTVTDELWRRIGPEAGAVDLRGPLRDWSTRLGKPVYPPLDGHWLDEGGIVMTKGLAEAVRPGVTSTWVTEQRKAWQAPADLPSLIGRAGTIEGNHYSLAPDGTLDQTRDVGIDFTAPLRLNTATGAGTISERVGLLGDSFTIRSLRYLAAAFDDITVLHYGKVQEDAGRAAGEMLAGKDVVAVEIVERTLASGNSVLLDPAVVDGITKVLASRPIR